MLNGCMTPTSAQWRLYNQPNTSWVSDDGSVIFSVDNDGNAMGIIRVNGESVEVIVVEGVERDTGMYLFYSDHQGRPANQFDNKCEYWQCSYKSPDMFVATVKETTFFEEGQKITFNKVTESSTD